MTDYCPTCKQKLRKETRSTKQHRLYWKWLTEISNELGYEKDEMHAYCKTQFLYAITGQPDMKKIRGSWYEIEISTTKLSTKQMADYLNRIERFANIDAGMTLSQPIDLYYECIGYTKERRA